MIFARVVYGDITVLNLITALLIFIGAFFLSKLLTFNIRRSFKDKLSREHLELIVKGLSYVILIIAVVWSLPHIGVEPSGLMVAGGIVGLAIGFASQNIVANLISGLFLIIERPIKIGDNVTISGIDGFVEDIHIVSTTMRTYDGLYVRVPNETVFTSNITNYVAYSVRRFEYRVGIRYADDAEEAIEIIKNIIKRHPLALVEPPSQAFVDELGDNSVDIIVRIWTPSTEWYEVKMELLAQIKTGLEEKGIQIPFPQRTIWFAGKQDSQRQQQSKPI
jgi:small-conductance mechanosensitive channel